MKKITQLMFVTLMMGGIVITANAAGYHAEKRTTGHEYSRHQQAHDIRNQYHAQNKFKHKEHHAWKKNQGRHFRHAKYQFEHSHHRDAHSHSDHREVRTTWRVDYYQPRIMIHLPWLLFVN